MDTRDILWKNVENATPETVLKTVLEYCDYFIEQKESGILREEEAGYAICGLIAHDVLSRLEIFSLLPTEVDAILEYACEMEIGREISKGAGIPTNAVWNTQDADAYKQKQWREFLALIDNGKKKLAENTA